MERRRASLRFLMGLRTEMCFTRDRFQTRRRTKVLMRRASTKMRNSVSASDLFSDLIISLNIYYLLIFFSDLITNEGSTSEWF